MHIIAISDLLRRIEAGASFRVIDVRTAAEFETSHAQGATNMPLERLSCDEMATLLAESDGPVYILCQSGSRAKTAHTRLEAAGIRGTYVVEGGTLAWQQAGLPMVYGTRRTISIDRQVRIIAGSMVVVGVMLSWFVSPWWNILPLLIGMGLTIAGALDFCGLAIVLARMPWNQSSQSPQCLRDAMGSKCAARKSESPS